MNPNEPTPSEIAELDALYAAEHTSEQAGTSWQQSAQNGSLLTGFLLVVVTIVLLRQKNHWSLGQKQIISILLVAMDTTALVAWVRCGRPAFDSWYTYVWLLLGMFLVTVSLLYLWASPENKP